MCAKSEFQHARLGVTTSAQGQNAKWPAVCGKSAYRSISEITPGNRHFGLVPKRTYANVPAGIQIPSSRKGL